MAVTPDAADLENLFEELAANLTKPGATNIVIDEIVIIKANKKRPRKAVKTQK